MRRAFGWWRREEGQSVVEFAMVVPMLLLMILGLVEFGRAWNTQQVLTDAAREALRSSVVSNPGFSYGQMEAVVDQALGRAGLDSERAQVTLDGWKAGTGTRARIEIEYEYELAFVGSLLGWVSGDRTLVLSTSFVMRNE